MEHRIGHHGRGTAVARQALQAGHRDRVKLSQGELGLLVGASREKVNREMRLLEARGVIAKRDGFVVIVRPGALDNTGADA